MSSKDKILVIGIFLIGLLLIVGINFLIPSLEIELNGDKKIELEVNTEYKELGATAILNKPFKAEKIDVKITGEVDTKTLGKYIITYTATHKNVTMEEQREVNVVDKTKPTITIKKPITACQKNNSISIEADVIDNYDGNISDRLKYNVEEDIIHLMASDSAGNLAEISEEIKYIDNEKPKITLVGKSEVSITLGEKYQDEGATAIDSCDGNLTKKITSINNIDYSKAGEYYITYQVQDENGNESKITRKLIIKAKTPSTPPASTTDNSKVNNGVIYLTFDDGPGQYTEKIINILAENNIKATFFVTNQFPKYQSLIKKEFEAGHTVGIHTYSHKWSVYDSVDTYLDDFNKIEDIVYKQTGVHPKYFRFPGGSSNTVSIKHCKGIMTDLAKIMTDKGYKYFDWTFDSGDTFKKNNTTNDIIQNVKNGLKGNGSYIILMHDIKKNTLAALPTIIKYAKDKGYVFKAIDESTPEKHFKIAN